MTSDNFLLCKLRGMLSRMLMEIATSIKCSDHDMSQGTEIIDSKSWENLVFMLRYLGRSPDTSDSRGLPSNPELIKFMISPSNGQGIFNTELLLQEEHISYPNAQLIDFIPNTYQSIKNFGSHISKNKEIDDFLTGMIEIKNYVTKNQPVVALLFQKIASVQMGKLKPGENVRSYYSEQLSELFSARMQNGEFGYANCDDLGIPKGTFPKHGKFELDYAGKALYLLHFPTDDC